MPVYLVMCCFYSSLLRDYIHVYNVHNSLLINMQLCRNVANANSDMDNISHVVFCQMLFILLTEVDIMLFPFSDKFFCMCVIA